MQCCQNRNVLAIFNDFLLFYVRTEQYGFKQNNKNAVSLCCKLMTTDGSYIRPDIVLILMQIISWSSQTDCWCQWTHCVTGNDLMLEVRSRQQGKVPLLPRHRLAGGNVSTAVCLFVCLFVNSITQNVTGEFSYNVGNTRQREELIKFCD